jgi:general secretion pathway protein L
MFGLNFRYDLDFRAFLRWWGSQLAFMVPSALRDVLWPQRPSLLIRPMGDQLSISFLDADQVHDLGVYPSAAAGEPARIKLFSDHAAMQDADQVLLLTPDVSLLRRFKLPYAAAENLSQVVAFELDRLTPFKAEQVYYSARIIERLAEVRQLRVEVALVMRDTLDPLLDAMLISGWRPVRVDVDNEVAFTRRHDLLPERFRTPGKRGPVWAAAGAGCMSIFLLCALMWLPLSMGQAMEARLRSDIKSASKLAAEVEVLKQEVDRITHENGFMLRKKREEPAMLDVLEELARVMPDDTWLNGLQYQGTRLIMQGQSPAASGLIEKLETSAYFKSVSFASPVTKDVTNGQERFQISTEVVNGRFAQPAQ